MARLPTIQERIVTTEVPQGRAASVPSTASGKTDGIAGLGSAYEAMGRAQQKLGHGLETIAAEIGAEVGRQAVTVGDDGIARADAPLPFTGAYGKAYTQAAEIGLAAETEMAAARMALELKQKHADDPEAFDVAWKEYSGRVIGAQDGPFRPMVESLINRTGSRAYLGLQSAKFERDTTLAKQRVETLLDEKTRDLENIAATGGTGTPEYAKAVADRDALIDNLVKNPLFGWTPEKADAFRRDAQRRDAGAALFGDAKRQYDATQDLAGTIERVEKALADPRLGLTPAEQLDMRNKIERGLQGSRAVRREERNAVNDAANRLRAAALVGNANDADFDAVIGMARKARLYSVEASLVRDRELFKAIPRITGGTAAEAAKTMAEIRSRAAQGVSALAPFLAPGKDLSHVDKIDGSLAGPLATMLNDMPENLRRQVKINSGYRTNERQAELYREAVAKYGSEEAARKWVAPPGRSNHNHGQAADLQYGSDEARKWMHENAARYGLHFPMGHEPWHIEPMDRTRMGPAMPIPSAALSGAAAAYDKRAKTTFEGIQKAYAAGVKPSDDELNELVTLYDQVSSPELRKAILEGAAAFDLVNEDRKKPLVDRMKASDEAQQKALAGGASPMERRYAELQAKAIEADTKLLAENPKAIAARDYKATVVPLDARVLASAENFAAFVDMSQRAVTVARTANPYSQVGGVFSPDEAATIRTALESGDARVVSNIMGGLARLSDDHLAATFAGKDFAAALKSGMASTDPAKYAATLNGLDTLYRRAPGEFSKSFGNDAVKEVQKWQARGRHMSMEELAKERTMRFDGLSAEIRAQMEGEAAREVGKLSNEEIVGLVAGRWGRDAGFGSGAGANASRDVQRMDGDLGRQIRADYQEKVKELYTYSGNLETAKTQAAEWLRTVWTPSDINGGRVMRNAPEKHYGVINGSHEWMREQLQETMNRRFGKPMTDAAPRGMQVIEDDPVTALAGSGGPVRYSTVPYMLMEGPFTQDDISQGRQPRYLVAYRDDQGFMQLATGNDGKPMHWRFDDTPYLAQQRDRDADLKRNIEVQRERVQGIIRPPATLPRGMFDAPDFGAQ